MSLYSDKRAFSEPLGSVDDVIDLTSPDRQEAPLPGMIDKYFLNVVGRLPGEIYTSASTAFTYN